MNRRFLLTCAVLCSLSGLYAVYAALVRPLVELPADVLPSPIAGLGSEPPRPVENVRIATTYLAHQPWTATAKYHLRSQQTFVYTNEWLPEGSEGRIRLQPFAMAFVDQDRVTGEERVVAVVSESALVKFAEAFEMPNPRPGRVVFAALDGPAQVSGPDGLLIDGKDFFFSESSASLWSDLPVHFEYARSGGSADNLQINLIPHEGLPGKDRPHIFGVQNVQLRKNVKMRLHLHQPGEPLVLLVRAGSFDYDVPQRRAVYSTDVQASHETGPAELNWIDCDRLSVEFAPADRSQPPTAAMPPHPAGEYQHIDQSLRFRRLLAESLSVSGRKRRPVSFNSHQHKLRATMDTLEYDGEQRTLTLTDPNGVWVRQDGDLNQLKSPQVVLQLGEGNQLAGARCQGPGWLVHRVGEISQVVFAADWRQELKYQPDPATGLDLWELGDSATFRQPSQGTALGADHLRLWAKPAEPAENSARPQLAPSAEQFEPRRMEAVGNVVLVSPRIEANCQLLEAWIETPDGSTPEAESGDGVQLAAATSRDRPGAEAEERPYHARAETIRLQMLSRPGRSPELSQIWTEGRVLLQQPDEQGRPGRTISGSRVHLQNRGAKDQVVHVYGKPAQIRDHGYYLEAHEAMHLDRAENRVWVNGGGALQFPLSSDLEGKALPQPQPLDITWKERMAFDGTLAAFNGKVTARLGDRQMTCQQMHVTLTDRVSFTESAENSRAVEVAFVRCRDNVTLKNFTYERQQLLEIQQAHVHELEVDRATGNLQAQGPGLMKMWRRGQAQRSALGPQQTAQANRPVDIEPAEWEFTSVKFDGRMEGNLEHRHSSFSERVEIVHGPVAGAHDELHRDRLNKGGGWMTCQKLEVMQQPSTDRRRGFLQLAGQGNVNLEGRDFYSLADQVVYDEATGFYTLRGFGRNKAKLWNERTPGQTTSPTVLQSMQFNPETRELRAIVIGGEGGR